MIIKNHYKITFDITQIIDRHIQIHSQDCVLIHTHTNIVSVILSNVTPLNNMLFNSYFENPTFELHVLYFLTCMPIFMPIGFNLPFNL